MKGTVSGLTKQVIPTAASSPSSAILPWCRCWQSCTLYALGSWAVSGRAEKGTTCSMLRFQPELQPFCPSRIAMKAPYRSSQCVPF